MHTLIRNQIKMKFSTAEQSQAGLGFFSHGQILDYSKFCHILVDKNCSHLDAAFMRSHGPGSFFFLAPATAAAILALAVIAGDDAEV